MQQIDIGSEIWHFLDHLYMQSKVMGTPCEENVHPNINWLDHAQNQTLKFDKACFFIA